MAAITAKTKFTAYSHLFPNMGQLFYAITMPSPLAGKVPCKGRMGIVKNNLSQKLLKLPAPEFYVLYNGKGP